MPAPTTIQVGSGWRSQRHLLEDDLGNVVVAPPVGRALGIGELVDEVAAAVVGQPLGLLGDAPGVVDQAALRRTNSMWAIFSGEVDAGITATNGSPERAKYASRQRWIRSMLRPRSWQARSSRCKAVQEE